MQALYSIRTADRALGNAVGDRQCGGGLPGGAIQESGMVHATAQLWLEDLFIYPDIQNAVGAADVTARFQRSWVALRLS